MIVNDSDLAGVLHGIDAWAFNPWMVTGDDREAKKTIIYTQLKNPDICQGY